MEARLLPTSETPPAPMVELTMTLEEFAVLEALRWRGLNGFSPVRTSLERAFDSAIVGLDPYWQTRIERAREVNRHCNIIEQVHEAFHAE